ncbi:site-specific integrase [Stutzerimonas frequens]|nr:site-specific integrase [Stutzerimonas frequens]MCQ4303732.1 site-specific integrase [Stutzerimonas frequens]
MMKLAPTYLYRNRHGTFYFRMVIPASLRPRINGKREIRRSLKTDSERLALKRARQHAVHFDSIFDRASRMTDHSDYEPSQEDIDLFDELCRDQKGIGVGTWSSPASAAAESEPVLSNAEIEERQRRHCIAELLEGRFDRPIRDELEPLARKLLALSRSYQPTELPRVLPKLRDELVTVSLTATGTPTATELPLATEPSHDPKMASWTLYDVWQHQLERDRADKTTRGGQAKHGGTLEESKRRARVMTVLTRHKPVCELTKQDWQFAYDAARTIRAGATVTIDPPSPLESLVTDDPGEMAGHERVTSLIGAMKRIQRHARFLDLTVIGPEDLLIKAVQKRENSRSRKGKPFSMEEVETIFSGYIYQGTPPANRTKAYPFWFWMPLVAYFTGARTNEIAQLDTADIREIDGHPCFDFRPDDPKAFEAKRVKTEEARQVPIHPRLIDLGFLDYLASQRTAKQKKLFGDGLAYLPPRDETSDHNKEGWAKSASKFFNEAPNGYLVAIGVHYPKSGKSLYSFRHTLETNLRNARRDGKPVDQTVIDAITGHAPNTIAGKHYDGGATIEHKLAALKLLPIPEAIQRLKSYQADFADRFGAVLRKSITSHRARHPRMV